MPNSEILNIRVKIFYLLNYRVVVQSMPVPDSDTFHSESATVKPNLARSRCISSLPLRREVRCLKCGRRKVEGGLEMHECAHIAARVLQRRIVY